MKAHHRALALLLLLGSSAQAQDVAATRQPAAQVQGWADTAWGMGVAEIQKLYPGLEIGPVDYVASGTAGRLRLELVGHTFDVYLRFRGVGIKAEAGAAELPREAWQLAEVELHLKPAGVACQRLGEALAEKYGAAAQRTSNRYADTQLWLLPATTVRHVSMKWAQSIECIVRYTPTSAADRDKI
jgi:hypothetical protein